MNLSNPAHNPINGELASSPNCWQCRHFAISWERSTPYLCSLMGFKSKLLPSLEVLRADGQMCRGFIAKPSADLNTAPNQSGAGGAIKIQVGPVNPVQSIKTQTVTTSTKNVWSA